MANSQRVRRRRIEKKYEKLIGKTIKAMKDKTMGELWAEFDKLKEQMAKEFEMCNIDLKQE